MRFNVYGTIVEVVRSAGCWQVFYPGNDGKKRAATDLSIPAEIDVKDVAQYLADLRHEYASGARPEVTRID